MQCFVWFAAGESGNNTTLHTRLHTKWPHRMTELINSKSEIMPHVICFRVFFVQISITDDENTSDKILIKYSIQLFQSL